MQQSALIEYSESKQQRPLPLPLLVLSGSFVPNNQLNLETYKPNWISKNFWVFVLFGTKLPWSIPFFSLLKYYNCKCHPKWGPDDLVSIPALNGTVECNKFLCFNLSDIDRKKKKKKSSNLQQFRELISGYFCFRCFEKIADDLSHAESLSKVDPFLEVNF